MNGIDFSKKLNRQNDLHQKSMMEARRNHSEEIENLTEMNDRKLKDRSETYSKSLENKEKDYVKNYNRVSEEQRKALLEKNYAYENALRKNEEAFHTEKKDNIDGWNKKFAELRDDFRKNLSDTKENDQDLRGAMDKNYKNNINNIRSIAAKDLNEYIDNTKTEKKESDVQYRIEKNNIIDKNQREMKELVRSENDKRAFILDNGISDVNDYKDQQAKNYINTRKDAEDKFQKQIAYTDDKIAKEIDQREKRTIESQIKDNHEQNKSFNERYKDLSKNYNKEVRAVEFRNRAEKISQAEVNKEIQKKYDENQKSQFDQRIKINLEEKNNIENKLTEKISDTIESYQGALREKNIKTGEKISKIENDLTESNRQERYLDNLQKEQLINNNRAALKYEKDKNFSTVEGIDKQNNLVIKNLKENFDRSLKSANEKSRKNFEETKSEMLADKRTLEKRLHEQNSRQTSNIREFYSDKIDKMVQGYESRINSLELQNKMIVQNSNEMIRDIKRISSAEIERQKKISADSTVEQVKTEKQIAAEKEQSLLKKLMNKLL